MRLSWYLVIASCGVEGLLQELLCCSQWWWRTRGGRGDDVDEAKCTIKATEADQSMLEQKQLARNLDLDPSDWLRQIGFTTASLLHHHGINACNLQSFESAS